MRQIDEMEVKDFIIRLKFHFKTLVISLTDPDYLSRIKKYLSIETR